MNGDSHAEARVSMDGSDKTLLDQIRSFSQIDCDTLDDEVARTLGPFVDHTSNQAISYVELQKPKNESIIREAIELAKETYDEYGTGIFSLSIEEIAVEIATIKLSSRMVQHLTGFAHIQVNPYCSYSAMRVVTNAKRIISMYKKVNPSFPASRICVKIPSTWAGLQACRELEAQGIHTLATTLFSMEQAAVAAHVKCTYIAPYVNELPVHFVPGYVDNDKGFDVTRAAQAYYERIGAKTIVMPASLTTMEEVLELAGAHHITVSPPLLAQLAATTGKQVEPVFLARKLDETAEDDYSVLLEDEAMWTMAFIRSKNGKNSKKLTDAINLFCDMQDNLVGLMKKYTGRGTEGDKQVT